MKQTKPFLLFVFCLIAHLLPAQQGILTHFTPEMQGMTQPAALPYEFFGSGQSGAVGVSYRGQMANNQATPTYQNAWIDWLFNCPKGTFRPLLSGYVQNSKYGPSQQLTGFLRGAMVYQNPNNWGISAGFSGGIQQIRLDLSQEMFVFKSPDLPLSTPSVAHAYFNMGVFGYGFLGQYQKHAFYGGVSVGLTNPYFTFQTANATLNIATQRRWNGMVGYIFKFRKGTGKQFIEPTVWLQQIDGSGMRCDARFRYQFWDYLSATVGCSSEGYGHLGTGLRFDGWLKARLRLNYGYNISTTSVRKELNTHELSLIFSKY